MAEGEESRAKTLDEIRQKHERIGNQKWNDLLHRYLQRTHISEKMGVPKNLKECQNCESVYDTKLLKRHMELCTNGAMKKFVLKNQQGQYFCKVCNEAPRKSQDYRKFKIHLASHSEEELTAAKYSSKDIFGKEGEKLILELNAKVEEEERIKKIKERLTKPALFSGSDLQDGLMSVYVIEKNINAVKVQSQESAVASRAIDDANYKQILYQAHYYELGLFKKLCMDEGILKELQSDNDESRQNPDLTYIRFKKQEILQSTDKLEAYKNSFKFMHLVRKLSIAGSIALQEMDESPNYIELAHKRYSTSLRRYFTLFPNQETTQYIILRMVQALQALHENFIAHRNLSPDDILVDDKSEIEVSISNFSKASSTTFINVVHSNSKSIYQSKQSQWEVGSTNHDLFSVGVMLVESLKGTDEFKRQIKSQKDLVEEVKVLLERKEVNTNLKHILRNTIMASTNLMPAAEIFQRLSLYYKCD